MSCEKCTKPEWLKIRPAHANSTEMKRFAKVRKRMEDMNLFTVCQEANCPNMPECWGQGTATFMILGDTCTRACKFCNVKTGYPEKIDLNESKNLVEAVKKMKLDYVVITSVDRDELKDQGANHFANCIDLLKKECPEVMIEVLIPDFRGQTELLNLIISSKPDVIGHNIETVRRLTPDIRDIRAKYDQSLNVLKYIKEVNPKIFTKSSIIVGFGEKEEELIQALKDLRMNQVDFLTMGQYLQPSPRHYPVKEYISPQKFKEYENIALNLGFLYAFCGPFVRSSYRAGEYFFKNLKK